MRLSVFADFRSVRDVHGRIRTAIEPRRYEFWARYLAVFDDVTVIARLSAAGHASASVTGPGVSFVGVPDYTGVAGYLRRLPSLRRSVAALCAHDSAFILHVPGRIGSLAAARLHRLGRPYCVELFGDPGDVFARGGVAHPLRPLLRTMLSNDLARVTHRAAAACYVTAEVLQRTYPCQGPQFSASDVELPPAAFAADSKHADPAQRAFRIVTVASLAQLYKGPDVLIDAIAQCSARGFDVSLVIVGDGRFRNQLCEQAQQLGVAERVTFRGELPAGAAVRTELDGADLFVLPSRADGLPRALLEAMARGLPCLASRVGGIPELLSEEDLLTPGDSTLLAERIEKVLGEPARRDDMAQRCFARAQQFTEARLAPRRRAFYQEVARQTASATPAASGTSGSGTSTSRRNATTLNPDR